MFALFANLSESSGNSPQMRTAEQIKEMFGDEYPAAVMQGGVRQVLWLETAFSRNYYSEDRKRGTRVSRCMDGSASMSLQKLQMEWSTWTEREQDDFCQSCVWLDEQDDYADMLRYITRHGNLEVWPNIAGQVGTTLPRDEAYQFLVGVLRAGEIGRSANVTQGIALTKHPEADATLRQHLQTVWNHSALWDNDDFTNWVAYDAICCISHLIELGASPADFESQMRALSQHVCAGTRDDCSNHLYKHYSWLPRPGWQTATGLSGTL